MQTHASSDETWLGQELTVPAGQLRAALRRAATAATRDGRCPGLDAVVLRWMPDGLMLAAADGYRIVNVTLRDVSIPARWVADASPHPVLLTTRTATALSELLDGMSDAELARFHLNARGNHVFVVAGGVTRLSPFVGDAYPTIPPIPDGWTEWRTRVTAETAALREALRAAKIGRRGGAPLLLEAAADRLRWYVRDANGVLPDAEGAVPARLEGDSRRVAPNGDYLLQILDTATSAQLQLSWGYPLKPLVVREVGAAATVERPAGNAPEAVSALWAVMPMAAPSVMQHRFAAP